MPTNTKKQHYVPQFLLKKFAYFRKKQAKVWVLDKQSGQKFSASVQDIAHENYFYEARSMNGHEVALEEFTEIVDGKGSSIIGEILMNERLPLSSPNLRNLVFFTSFQMSRTPYVRNQMEALRNKIVEKWGPDVRAKGDDKPVSAYTTEDSKYISMVSLLSSPQMAEFLFDKIMFLAKPPKDQRFIISDYPVTRNNEVKYEHRGNLGLAQKGIEVYFPISPKFCLYFVCRSHADMMLESPIGQIWNQLQKEGLPITFAEENVTFVNSLQVIQSERWLYAQCPSDLELPIQMLKENPSLKLPASSLGFD
jgi:Protein of unknown function (DUF4238)